MLETVDALEMLAFLNGTLILIFFVGCVLVNHVKFRLIVTDDKTFVELAENVEILEILLFYAFWS